MENTISAGQFGGQTAIRIGKAVSPELTSKFIDAFPMSIKRSIQPRPPDLDHDSAYRKPMTII